MRGIHAIFLGTLVLLLAGCEGINPFGQTSAGAEDTGAPLEAPLVTTPPVAESEVEAEPLPEPDPENPAPPASSVITPAAGAPAPTAQPSTTTAKRGELGRTIASLGNPADPGLWIVTGLVTETQPGQLRYPANGKSVNVELRPSGREASAGSQVSLAAFRALGAPLTDLPELIVMGGAS